MFHKMNRRMSNLLVKERNKMKILIATKNPGKIEGAKQAFLNYYETVEIEGIAVSSDVPDEPVNDEIYKGAKNRVSNLKRYAKEKKIEADFYIAIESGITNQLGRWEILSIAVIENLEGMESWGSSSGFPIPDKYVKEIIQTEFSKVMEKIFHKENGLRNGNGGISLLTKNKITRIDLTKQSFIMALTKFINGDIWC